MKASELRIGNLVNGVLEDVDGKRTSTICRITGIDERG